MTQDDVLDAFREAGALLEGHFVLSSGRHSSKYLQCARVLMNPARAAKLCGALATKIEAQLGQDKIDLVVAPAMGGVVVGYEMARQFSVDGIFTERVDGVFTLRRGFNIPNGARVLMSEDVVTTGKSSRECIKVIEELGGQVVAASCLIDRSAGQAEVGVPLIALTELEVPSYAPNEVPPELAALPVEKPGSRFLKT